ncbi:unannotated protein [freshwater metagenome]|uniref:Unannotated protein n=1 Tax=freshwater metagenome TaxID=449393 RepID=A0A6J6YE08_9ZZZZ
MCLVVGNRVTNDRKTKPGSARLATSGLIDSVEPLENSIDISSGNTDSMVSDPHEYFSISALNGHFDFGSRIRVLNSVIDEVSDCRKKLSALTHNHRCCCRDMQFDLDA